MSTSSIAVPSIAPSTLLAGRNVSELAVLWAVHALLATVVLLPGTPLDVLRPVVALVYLLLVPGLLLAGVLRIYQEDQLALLVTAVGLSLIYVMVLGLMLSGIPASFVERPLAAEVFVPVSLAITGVLALAVPQGHSILGPLAPVAKFRYLGWALLPFAAVYVALHVQGGGSILWMVFLLGAISATPLLLLVRRPTAAECVVAIFCIALALAFHKSFAAPVVHGGGDIRREIFFAIQVLDAGRWSPDASHIYGAMLSITALPVAVSDALNQDLIPTFKLFYGFILAFIPAVIFLTIRNLFGARWALVGAFLYLGNFVFGAMPGLTRQIVATLLVALLVMTITNASRTPVRIRSVQLALGLGVVFSHYSLLPVLVIAFGASLIVKWIGQWRGALSVNQVALLPTLGLLVPVLVFTLFWFNWTVDGSLFHTFVSLARTVIEAMKDELLFNRQATTIASGVIPNGISFIMLLLANWLIVFGSLLGLAICFFGFLRRDRFLTFLGAIGSGGILLGGLFLLLPETSESLNTHRAFFMTFPWLLLLALGGLKWMFSALHLTGTRSLAVIAALALSVYIALGTGLVTHLIGDDDFTYALDRRLTANFNDDAALSFLSNYWVRDRSVYSDKWSHDRLYLISHQRRLVVISEPSLPPGSEDGFLLYVREPNKAGEWVIKPFILGQDAAEIKRKTESETAEFVEKLRGQLNLVYESKGVTIYDSAGDTNQNLSGVLPGVLR